MTTDLLLLLGPVTVVLFVLVVTVEGARLPGMGKGRGAAATQPAVVAELVWEEIAQAAPPHGDWPGWLRSLGHAIRDLIHQHPGTLGLWVTQPIAPVPALELFDAQLAYCEPGSREDGARVLKVVSSFAIGFAGSELSWFPASEAETPETDAQRISRIARTLPPNAPDRLIDVALLVCTGDTGDVFDTGLDLMIGGLGLPTG